MEDILTNKDLNEIYLNKCNNEREKINFVKDIYAIGDLHGDFNVLIKILLKYDLIIKTKKYKYEEIEFDYKLNDNLNSLCIIQVGDQLDGNRHLDYSLNNFVDEDYKIVIYFDCLKKQIKELKLKDVYIISLIGNHEYMNLKKIYKYVSPYNLDTRDDFIEKQKLNILCNRYYCIVVNGFVFSHCGIVKTLILNLDMMYPKLNIINNLKNLETIEEKIDYLDKLIKILFLKKINNDDKFDIEEFLYKFVGSRYFYGGNVDNDEKYNNNCNELNNINELIHIDNMVIGHTMQYNGIKQYKCNIKTSYININKNKNNNKNIFIIDTGLSKSFQLKTLKQILHIHFNNINNLNDYNIEYGTIN